MCLDFVMNDGWFKRYKFFFLKYVYFCNFFDDKRKKVMNLEIFFKIFMILILDDSYILSWILVFEI